MGSWFMNLEIRDCLWGISTFGWDCRRRLRSTSGAYDPPLLHLFRKRGCDVVPRRLTQQQVENFARDGFVSPVRVLSAAEAAECRGELESMEVSMGGASRPAAGADEGAARRLRRDDGRSGIRRRNEAARS